MFLIIASSIVNLPSQPLFLTSEYSLRFYYSTLFKDLFNHSPFYIIKIKLKFFIIYCQLFLHYHYDSDKKLVVCIYFLGNPLKNCEQFCETQRDAD